MSEAHGDMAELGVGFLIDTGGSFDELMRLQKMMESTEMKVLQEAKKIEAATGGMVKLGGATNEIVAFGNAGTREMRDFARETKSAERAAEGMVRQLEREIEVFGKSASEIRQMRVETKALAAERVGLTEVAGRLRDAGAQMKFMETAGTGVSRMSGRARNDLANLSFQANDVATMFAMGADPMRIFASQAGQIAQIAQTAEGGIKGLAGNVGALALRFAPLLVVAGTAYAAMSLFTSSLEKDAGLKEYSKSLGLTKEEMGKLKDVGVTTGDVMVGIWRTLNKQKELDEFVKRAKGLFSDLRDGIVGAMRYAGAALYGALVGGYDGILATWRRWPAAFADLFLQGVNKAIDGINWLARGVNKLLGTDVLGQMAYVRNDYAGAGAEVGAAFATGFNKAVKEANTTFDQLGKNIVGASRDRTDKDAKALIDARTDKAQKNVKDTLTDAEKAAQRLAEFNAKMLDERASNMGALHKESVAILERWAQPIGAIVGLEERLSQLGEGNGQQLDRNGPLAQAERGMAIGAALEDAMSGGFRDVSRTMQSVQEAMSLAFGPNGPLVRTLGDLAGGAGIGTAVAGAMGGSKVAGALGGAIGGEVGKKFLETGLSSISASLGGMAGPLGSVAGGVIASFASSMLKSTKKASATIGAIGDQLGLIETAGNSASREKASAAAATNLLGSLAGLADQLGGSLGSAGRVSIGIRDGDYRVDTSGKGATKVKKGAVDFGEDQQAAIEFALRDLIADGAIVGLKEATARLLNSGTDLERQVQKALDFEGVFSALKQATDPVGFAIETLDKQFEGLRATFKEASASIEETAQLEQLYQIRRDAVSRQAEEQLNDRRRLEAQLMEAQGDAAGALALNRQIELAGIDAGLRALQQQIYAADDAADAATAAAKLSEAWTSVGDTIMDEVRRIRGLTDEGGGASFASLQGQFNAANTSAQAGDMDAAKLLPGLSKSLLDAAAQAATSRQELERVRAQTAAALEATYGVVGALTGAGSASPATTLAAAATATQATSAPSQANEDLRAGIAALRDEVVQMRQENNAGMAAVAGSTRSIDNRLNRVTRGGDEIIVAMDVA